MSAPFDGHEGSNPSPSAWSFRELSVVGCQRRRPIVLSRKGYPNRRRDPLGRRASDEPCGFDSRPFRWLLVLRNVRIDGARGVTAAREIVDLAAVGSTPPGTLHCVEAKRGVLLGEDSVSKADGPGSNPGAPAALLVPGGCTRWADALHSRDEPAPPLPPFLPTQAGHGRPTAILPASLFRSRFACS